MIGEVFSSIFTAAFGPTEAFAGTTAGIVAAMMNGAKRGLFSNEAGMGSAPNAAATASVTHPVRQGLIQSLGVFVDTMIVCSSTAFIVLASGLYNPSNDDSSVGATLTQDSVAASLGDWTIPVMTFLIFVFAFSSLLGNYSYAEVNLQLLTDSTLALTIFRWVVIVFAFIGGILSLQTVWDLADVAMACMALVNLVAILLLSKVAFVVLADFEKQRREGKEPVFVLDDHPELEGRVDPDVWSRAAQAKNPT